MAKANDVVDVAGVASGGSNITSAAYLPFRTFIGAIESLEHGIPKKIDRTIWPSQSGVVQGQILMALRFFHLVDENDYPTTMLHQLVEEKDKRKDNLRTLLNVSYGEIIGHDLTKMTPKMLDDLMDKYNVSGDTKRKAVTFFLRTAKFAEVPMHPLLSSQVRNTGPRKRKVGKGLYIPKMNGVADPAYSKVVVASEKAVRLKNGGTVTLRISVDPFTLPSEDRQFVFELVDKLQAYADANPTSDGEEDEEEEP
jgi:hypothetical protein